MRKFLTIALVFSLTIFPVVNVNAQCGGGGGAGGGLKGLLSKIFKGGRHGSQGEGYGVSYASYTTSVGAGGSCYSGVGYSYAPTVTYAAGACANGSGSCAPGYGYSGYSYPTYTTPTYYVAPTAQRQLSCVGGNCQPATTLAPAPVYAPPATMYVPQSRAPARKATPPVAFRLGCGCTSAEDCTCTSCTCASHHKAPVFPTRQESSPAKWRPIIQQAPGGFVNYQEMVDPGPKQEVKLFSSRTPDPSPPVVKFGLIFENATTVAYLPQTP